jgi:hypothetical protein
MSELAVRKGSIVRVRAEENCIAHALIIAIAKLNKDPEYESFRKGYKKILPNVQHLLTATGIDLSRGGG